MRQKQREKRTKKKDIKKWKKSARKKWETYGERSFILFPQGSFLLCFLSKVINSILPSRIPMKNSSPSPASHRTVLGQSGSCRDLKSHLKSLVERKRKFHCIVARLFMASGTNATNTEIELQRRISIEITNINQFSPLASRYSMRPICRRRNHLNLG